MTTQATASPHQGRRSGVLSTLAPFAMFLVMGGMGLAILFRSLSPFEPVPVLFATLWLTLLVYAVVRWVRRRAGLGPVRDLPRRGRWDLDARDGE